MSPAVFRTQTLATAETRLASVHRMADAACATLGVARAFWRCGRVVDLSGLDGELGRLCAYALDLPPEDGRAIRPRLIAIRAELEILAEVISATDGSPTT